MYFLFICLACNEIILEGFRGRLCVCVCVWTFGGTVMEQAKNKLTVCWLTKMYTSSANVFSVQSYISVCTLSCSFFIILCRLLYLFNCVFSYVTRKYFRLYSEVSVGKREEEKRKKSKYKKEDSSGVQTLPVLSCARIVCRIWHLLCSLNSHGTL